METNTEEVAYLDVTIYKDGKCIVEIDDNGQLAKVIATAMVQDDNLLALLAEAYIIYQEKIGIGNSPKVTNLKN